jgi:hypothetical protein
MKDEDAVASHNAPSGKPFVNLKRKPTTSSKKMPEERNPELARFNRRCERTGIWRIGKTVEILAN